MTRPLNELAQQLFAKYPIPYQDRSDQLLAPCTTCDQGALVHHQPGDDLTTLRCAMCRTYDRIRQENA